MTRTHRNAGRIFRSTAYRNGICQAEGCKMPLGRTNSTGLCAEHIRFGKGRCSFCLERLSALNRSGFCTRCANSSERRMERS